MTAPTRVRRGALVLDERGPVGWRARLDVDRLDVGSPFCCVIGQLYVATYPNRPFTFGLQQLGLLEASHPWLVEHGFAADHVLAYVRLTDAWRAYLTTYPTTERSSA